MANGSGFKGGDAGEIKNQILSLLGYMQEIRILVSGIVQGVGFRAVVKRHALLHDIKGFVRNLPDGRVEICAQGHGDQINQFIHTVEKNPGAGSISSIETKYKPMQETYSSFEVR